MHPSCTEQRALFVSLVLCLLGFFAEPKSAWSQQTSPVAIPDAQADCLSDARCSELYEDARRLSLAGQYTAALAGYQAAYAQTPTPWLLVNIGRLHQKMGRLDLAIRSFRQFLDDPRAAQDEESQEKAREYLRQAESSSALRLQKTTVNPPAQDRTPDHKKWWFWSVLGGATVLTFGLVLGLSTKTPSVANDASTYAPVFQPRESF